MMRWFPPGSSGSMRCSPPPGRMTMQLQYHIEIRPRSPGQQWLAAYETVWRTPGVWDYLTESNAERSVVHLGTLIGVCLALL